MNLIGNAIKFTKEGGVTTSVTLVNESDTHIKLKFQVTDTGIGIPDDRMNQLFQSFSQVDASMSRKYGGTGLGLVISKQLAEMMGGQIGVESQAGKGSTFWFTANLLKYVEGVVTFSKEENRIQEKHILVVDDNLINKQVVTSSLSLWGCRFEEASSGETAFLKLQKAAKENDPFHIIMMNMQLSDMDGEALGQKIKSDPLLKDTLLIMLASTGLRGDVERLKKIGFSAYLTKPMEQSALYDCLASLVAERPGIPEKSDASLITRHTIAKERKKKVHILLAEDNIVNQKVALRLLKKLGYQADVVNNGKEVLESIKRGMYNFILMDVQMPEMDGYETTRAVRRMECEIQSKLKLYMNPSHDPDDHFRIPIIAMTAHTMKGDRERCLKEGMDDYVSKPIRLQALSDAIDRQINKIFQ